MFLFLLYSAWFMSSLFLASNTSWLRFLVTLISLHFLPVYPVPIIFNIFFLFWSLQCIRGKEKYQILLFIHCFSLSFPVLSSVVVYSFCSPSFIIFSVFICPLFSLSFLISSSVFIYSFFSLSLITQSYKSWTKYILSNNRYQPGNMSCYVWYICILMYFFFSVVGIYAQIFITALYNS